MQRLHPFQLAPVSGDCDSWYHFAYCRDSGATQAEFEMEYGNRTAPIQEERYNGIPLS